MRDFVIRLVVFVVGVAAVTLIVVAVEPDPTTQTVTQWLDAQAEGSDGSEFWSAGSSPVRFYAVTGYEIVNDRVPGVRVVRVHSSTAAGFPIVRLWEVGASDGKIVVVRPAD